MSAPAAQRPVPAPPRDGDRGTTRQARRVPAWALDPQYNRPDSVIIVWRRGRIAAGVVVFAAAVQCCAWLPPAILVPAGVIGSVLLLASARRVVRTGRGERP